MFIGYFRKYQSLTLILLSFLALAGTASGQDVKVRGRIRDASCREPVAYATVYNLVTKTGTISNPEGFFEIGISGRGDSLVFSCVGYNRKVIPLSGVSGFLEVKMEAGIQLLNEVVIRAPEYSGLCRLLAASVRNSSPLPLTTRSYYSLKSFIDSTQVELVEAYYNAEVSGYELNSLEMKTGRFALKQYEDWLYYSQSTSLAILRQKLCNSGGLFPANPLEYGARRMEKLYYLELEKNYLDDTGDSVYVIRFSPKDKTGRFFWGRVWLDPVRKSLVKLDLECRNCAIHPFVPLGPSDSLNHVGLKISRTFRKDGERIVPNHTDFSYSFDYLSRRTTRQGVIRDRDKKYHISSSALFYSYDYTEPFSIPRFSFSGNGIRDYHKINAMPYNRFFWEEGDESRMKDENGANNRFFAENESMSNRTIFVRSESPLGSTLYESPYVYWSEKRITIREVAKDSLLKVPDLTQKKAFVSDMYKLEVKIFMDVNTYKDSTNVIAAAIFDPYETFYLLPSDERTLCFINIYFDLYEIARRKFMEKINHQKISEPEIQAEYDRMISELKAQVELFQKEVSRGENLPALKKWNQLVVNELGIDNISLFLPDKKE